MLTAGLFACAPAPAVLDEGEMARIMQLRETQLHDLAIGWGITEVPPTPDLVRWITLEESAETTVDCMNAAGFPAQNLGDGGVSYEGTPDDQAGPGGPFWVALWTCSAEYSVDPRTQELLDDKQFHILYDYYDTTLRDCLERHGVEIQQAPSFATFVEEYYTGYPWVPWSEVSLADVGQEDYVKLSQECPQAPPSSELYGAPLPQP